MQYTGRQQISRADFMLPGPYIELLPRPVGVKPKPNSARIYEKAPVFNENGGFYSTSGDIEPVRLHPQDQTKSKPNGVGSILKGGARERADDDFFAVGIKNRRSKADFAPTWSVRPIEIFAEIHDFQGFAGLHPLFFCRFAAMAADFPPEGQF
ncbi:MAG: hypothetical protein ACOX81_06840, partial [Candidatus Heteroscillospira sp.]